MITVTETEYHRVLDAAKACCNRWGVAKVSVEDVAAEAGVSRATLYRLFPGGRDTLLSALHRREATVFFADLAAHIAETNTLEELVVRVVVEATRALRADIELQIHLASEPGEVLQTLGFAQLPRIVDVATEFLTPRCLPFLPPERAGQLAEWLTRVVLSYFLTPSEYCDLGDEASALRFVRGFVLPAFTESPAFTETEVLQ